MFRAPLCPSSGAQEFTNGCCLWYLALWFTGRWSGVELWVMCPVCGMLLDSCMRKTFWPRKYKIVTKVKLRNLTFYNNYFEVFNERKTRIMIENCVLEYWCCAQQRVLQVTHTICIRILCYELVWRPKGHHISSILQCKLHCVFKNFKILPESIQSRWVTCPIFAFSAYLLTK